MIITTINLKVSNEKNLYIMNIRVRQKALTVQYWKSHLLLNRCIHDPILCTRNLDDRSLGANYTLPDYANSCL